MSRVICEHPCSAADLFLSSGCLSLPHTERVTRDADGLSYLISDARPLRSSLAGHIMYKSPAVP